MSIALTNLTQEELFKVLRGILKATQNEFLPNLGKKQRVQALFSAIEPSTWEKACEKHFALSLEKVRNKEANKEGNKEGDKVDPKAVYLQYYPKNRFEL